MRQILSNTADGSDPRQRNQRHHDAMRTDTFTITKSTTAKSGMYTDITFCQTDEHGACHGHQDARVEHATADMSEAERNQDIEDFLAGQEPEPANQHPQRPAVLSFLQAMEAAGFKTCHVDDGPTLHPVTTPEQAADIITSVDIATARFADPEGGRPCFAFLVLGNADWELVNDHSDRDSETGRRFTAAIEAWSDATEEAAAR